MHENVYFGKKRGVRCEITLYDDGELEIVLVDRKDSLSYIIPIKEFVAGLERASDKLGKNV